MKRLTTKEFIKKSKKVHGDKYDYSKVTYKNASTKIIIICKIHGEFEQMPNGHLCGKGCFLCGIKKRSDNITSTVKDFMKKARVSHGGRYDYSKMIYINSKTKITITCKEHGEFRQSPNSHLSRHGCPKCKGLTTEEFIEKSQKVHGDKYDYSNVEYKKCDTKVKIICEIHGEFKQRASSHLQGSKID